MELATRRWGFQDFEISQQKPVITLLHGMGGTGALWRPIAAFLEEDFQVLAPDQRGHGGSQNLPKNSTYAPLDYAQDLVESFQKWQIHRSTILGHSMGVRTAAAFAHLQPLAVEALILVDLGLTGHAGGGLGRDLRNFLSLLPLTFSSRSEARQWMMDRGPDPSIVQYLLAVSQVESQSGAVTFPFDREALIATIDTAENSRVRDWIEEAAARSTPVLILRGADSRVWTAEEFQQEKSYFSAYPNVQFMEISGAGHGLPFEKRSEFITVIRDFLKP